MGALGVVALLRVLRVAQVEHEIHIVAAVGAPYVLAVVRPGACNKHSSAFKALFVQLPSISISMLCPPHAHASKLTSQDKFIHNSTSSAEQQYCKPFGAANSLVSLTDQGECDQASCAAEPDGAHGGGQPACPLRGSGLNQAYGLPGPAPHLCGAGIAGLMRLRT